MWVISGSQGKYTKKWSAKLHSVHEIYNINHRYGIFKTGIEIVKEKISYCILAHLHPLRNHTKTTNKQQN